MKKNNLFFYRIFHFPFCTPFLSLYTVLQYFTCYNTFFFFVMFPIVVILSWIAIIIFRIKKKYFWNWIFFVLFCPNELSIELSKCRIWGWPNYRISFKVCFHYKSRLGSPQGGPPSLNVKHVRLVLEDTLQCVWEQFR